MTIAYGDAMQVELLNTLQLPIQSVRIMVAVLVEHGINADSLLAEAGIDTALLSVPDATISGQQELGFQQAFARETAMFPGCWMRTGLRYRMMSYGHVGLAVLAAKDVRTGLEVLGGFQALTYSLIHYEVNEHSDGVISLVANDSQAPEGLRPFLNERALGSVTTWLNDMVQGRMPIERIESNLAHSPGWQGCDDLLGNVVHFGAAQTRWVLSKGVGESPLPMASPLLEQSYQQICAKLIGDSLHVDPIVRGIYDLLVRSGRGFATAARIAEILGVSERTLHRRLDRNHTSFGKILDEVRLVRSKDLLRSSTLAISVIADMLGFAETSSFSRSFKRLAGISPAAYRSGGQLRAGDQPPLNDEAFLDNLYVRRS